MCSGSFQFDLCLICVFWRRRSCGERFDWKLIFRKCETLYGLQLQLVMSMLMYMIWYGISSNNIHRIVLSSWSNQFEDVFSLIGYNEHSSRCNNSLERKLNSPALASSLAWPCLPMRLWSYIVWCKSWHDLLEVTMNWAFRQWRSREGKAVRKLKLSKTALCFAFSQSDS